MGKNRKQAMKGDIIEVLLNTQAWPCSIICGYFFGFCFGIFALYFTIPPEVLHRYILLSQYNTYMLIVIEYNIIRGNQIQNIIKNWNNHEI